MCPTIDLQLELFDRVVLPILTYGCEIWGCTNVDIIEKVHLKYCKYVLNVKTTTPDVMVYGELGITPISVDIKNKTISYWTN